MKNKFKFLTRDSLKKKICTKSFKIINIIICLITICLINLDSIVKFFGGDFEEQINVYIVDEVGIYDDLEETMKSGYKDILDNYNAKISKEDKTIDKLRFKYGYESVIRSCFLHSGINPIIGGVMMEEEYPMMSSQL